MYKSIAFGRRLGSVLCLEIAMSQNSWSSRNAARVQRRTDPTAVAAGELRKSADTRARILDAAIRHLVEQGYQKLSVASVAERAGFTRAAAIYHFPSRKVLLQAIATYLLDKRLALYWEAVRDVPESTEQIKIFVNIYWEQVTGDLFVAFTEMLVAARTDAMLAAILAPELERYERERARYSELIFTHEMRETAGERFDIIRDVARFLIEGMAFATTYSTVAPERVERVKADVIRQMEAAYRG